MPKFSERFEILHARLNELTDRLQEDRYDVATRLVEKIVKHVAPKSPNEKRKDDGFPLLYPRWLRNWRASKQVYWGRISGTPLEKPQQEALKAVVTELVRFHIDAKDDYEFQKEYAQPLRKSCLVYLKSVGDRVLARPPKVLPHWDRDAKVLKYDGKTVKQLRQNAGNQMRVLDTFQELGWPREIDDPLTSKKGVTQISRAHNTAKSLNLRHDAKLIRFGTTSLGTRFSWARTVRK